MKKFSLKYDDVWFDYCIELNPLVIQKVIQEEYIVSNKKRIHLDIYETDLENIKPTILFIHGTAVYSRFYTEFLYGLYREGYRVVALDLPGHGLSDGRRGHFSMEELVAAVYDVTSFIRDKYSKKVVVIGSSLGGITTLYSLANDPRISAGVCVNAAILNEKAHKKMLKIKGIFKLGRPFVPLFARLLPRFRMSVWIYLDPKELIKNEESNKVIETISIDKLLSDRYSLKSLCTQMRAPMAKPIEEIRTPTMILNGGHDVLFSVEYMKEILERLKNSVNKKLVVIENGSHLILTENREECITKIIKWLNEIEIKNKIIKN